MRKSKVYFLLAGLAAMAVLGLLLAFVIVPGISNNKDNSSASPQQIASAPGDRSEGVLVHGHWTIEVRNTDGTLAERREFDNSLMPGGKALLVKLLARQSSMGGWDIRLIGSPTSQGAFQDETGSRTLGGVIFESSYPEESAPNMSKNLVVNIPTTGEYVGDLVLSGTITANVDGNISLVQLEAVGHAVTEVSSSTYYGTSWASYTFSGTGISKVTLTAGQMVTVTVAVSFS
jgi:hypothetical protein